MLQIIQILLIGTIVAAAVSTAIEMIGEPASARRCTSWEAFKRVGSEVTDSGEIARQTITRHQVSIGWDWGGCDAGGCGGFGF